MKKILIMRHGKSDWGAGSQRDYDRPLNERGLRETEIIGKELKKRGLTPDLIISSPAERAKITAERIAENSGYEKDIIWDDNFYFGFVNEIISVLKKLKNEIETVMIVGHNPTWSDLVEKLAGKFLDMKTADVCILEFEENWEELNEKKCRFIELISPKDL